MGRLLPVFLMRAATLVVASLLLFAVFGHARAMNLLSPFSGVAASAATAAVIQ
ncbi:MAG TPA: hypothetical protein VJQ06_09680 [Rhizomicrobium sp.]|nr:hypothetical protein [Rhizomicrobium sp.]